MEQQSTNICVHAFISGRVQGVFFRNRTCHVAKDKQLTGWVKNLSDGRVEVMACGESLRVNELIEWLRHGPPLASVKEVDYQTVQWQDFADFIIV